MANPTAFTKEKVFVFREFRSKYLRLQGRTSITLKRYQNPYAYILDPEVTTDKETNRAKHKGVNPDKSEIRSKEKKMQTHKEIQTHKKFSIFLVSAFSLMNIYIFIMKN